MAQENPLVTWYVGEQKLLRWTVTDRQKNRLIVTGWTTRLTIYRRREAAPVLTLAVAPDPIDTSVLTSLVTAADTTTLGAGSYRYVLERTDLGAEQVLATEDIVLNRRGA